MSRPTRVLCVHENRFRLNTRKKILENAGYDVCWTGTGMDGLLQFRAFIPDIVVIDYELPDVTGDVVAGGIKRINPRVPLLMFVPNIFLPPSAVAAADGWLLNGDSPELLLAKVRELLENDNASAA